MNNLCFISLYTATLFTWIIFVLFIFELYYSVLKYLQYLLLRLHFIVWNIFFNIYKNLNMQNIGWVFRDKHLVLKTIAIMRMHLFYNWHLHMNRWNSHTCWIKPPQLRPRYYSDLKCEGRLWQWKLKKIPNERGTQMHKLGRRVYNNRSAHCWFKMEATSNDTDREKGLSWKPSENIRNKHLGERLQRGLWSLWSSYRGSVAEKNHVKWFLLEKHNIDPVTMGKVSVVT